MRFQFPNFQREQPQKKFCQKADYRYYIIILNMLQKIIEQQRAKSSVCPHKLGAFVYGQQYYKDMKFSLQMGPVLDHTPNLYNKSRLELIKDSYRYLPLAYNFYVNHLSRSNKAHQIHNMISNPHQPPGAAHFGMFIKYIQLMCTEKQKEVYLQKSIKCEIFGCYAQTQLGHGSDIRSLQTTAQLDIATKEWILDSPTISSAKYWPGELSFLANYAIIFAQTIIKGKNFGVNPFLLKIKDDQYNWLPGIEGGDIGPKIGFHSKQNGYMLLRSVRVPKQNLWNRFVEVSDSGEYKNVGDPRIGYGTMMSIREIISCQTVKAYSIPITIGARYSLFRKQFMDQNKQELTIIDYQTQQDKIITRIAEYYAINVGGNKIRQVSEDNGRRVLKSDFSLLQETHSNLAFSKGLYSEIVHQGIQTIRRSIGGHGTSYYSGVPQIMNEYVAVNTLEGQNTVLYLQVSRYVLKNYLGYITKGKSLAQSVAYIARFAQLENTRFVGKNQWTLEQLRDLLVKTLNYLVTLIGTRISSKAEGETQMDIINYKVGIRLQQLAQIHGLHFTIDQYITSLKSANQDISPILSDLCKLFIIAQIHRLAQPIVEGGFVCPVKWALLNLQKERILKTLRPHIAVLLDSFGIPDKYLRSELTHGDPYLNYLNRARECEINTAVTDAARNVGKIKEVLAAKPRI